MEVKTKKKPQTIDDLIKKEATVGYDEPFMGMIAETYSDPSTLSGFGFSEAAISRGRSLAEAAEDNAPQFVVVRTEEGASRSGRLYGAEILDSIAEQVNAKQPVAYLGHIPDHELGTALPDPQTNWFAALTRKEASDDPQRKGQIVKVIYTAGYNLPDAKVRTYLKTKVVNSTSWQGLASQTPIPGQGVKVTSIDLHSIDWARKGSEGVQTARVVALAREMHTKEGKTSMDGDGKSLAEVTPEEFKAENPNGYSLLVREIQGEQQGTIDALTTQVEDATKDKTLLEEIRGVLKLTADADPLQAIAALAKKLGEKAKITVDEALDKLLAEKVPDEEQRKIVTRLLQPVAEMATEKAKEIDDEEKVETLVNEMVTAAFNDDDVIKGIVSEMSPPIVGRREQIKNGDGKVDLGALGMRRERKMVSA